MEWFVLDQLLAVEAQLIAGQSDITRQRELIAHLEERGQDACEEGEVLDDLERTQEIVERSYRQLVEASKSREGIINRPA